MDTSLKEIWKELQKYTTILTTLHPSPDGDSLGSCAALKYALEREGKDVRIVSPHPLDTALARLPFAKEVEYHTDVSDINPDEYDCLVLLDCASQERISAKQKETFQLPKNKPIINIDHHPTNDNFGTHNYVDPHEPSTCAILIDLYKENNIVFDKELSERLLLGVATDSGFLTFGKNLHVSIEKTLFLMKQGADYRNAVMKPLLYNQPLKTIRARAHALDNLTYDKKTKLGLFTYTKNILDMYGVNQNDVKFVIQDIHNIQEIEIACILREVDTGYAGSFRSNKGIDVLQFAQELNGGGHKAAAGFSLPHMSKKHAEQTIIDTIAKVGIHKEK